MNTEKAITSMDLIANKIFGNGKENQKTTAPERNNSCIKR